MNILCRECNTSKPESEFFRASKRQYIDRICKTCKNVILKGKRQKLKEDVVAFKGGKCERCEYDNCIAALEMHHFDPDEKELSFHSGNLVAYARWTKEASKCFLLCANCHREVHATDDPTYIKVI